LFHQALIHANTASKNYNFPHKAVELSTYGLVFLGTPHQDADDMDLVQLMFHILSIYSKNDDAVLNDLQLHSPALRQQLNLYSAISPNI
jgi:hypothetical protein